MTADFSCPPLVAECHFHGVGRLRIYSISTTGHNKTTLSIRTPELPFQQTCHRCTSSKPALATLPKCIPEQQLELSRQNYPLSNHARTTLSRGENNPFSRHPRTILRSRNASHTYLHSRQSIPTISARTPGPTYPKRLHNCPLSIRARTTFSTSTPKLYVDYSRNYKATGRSGMIIPLQRGYPAVVNTT